MIIIGDFTGTIGDPSGKSKTRNQLSKEEVEINAKTYLDQIFKIIDRDKTELHSNSEWFENISFREVLELSSKVTVARMLERDDFSINVKKEDINVTLSPEHTEYKWLDKDSDLLDEYIKSKLDNI